MTINPARDYGDVRVLARVKLGSYYDYGLGVNQNYAEAVNWYSKAISASLVSGGDMPARGTAMRNLGILYAYGLGVQRKSGNS